MENVGMEDLEFLKKLKAMDYRDVYYSNDDHFLKSPFALWFEKRPNPFYESYKEAQQDHLTRKLKIEGRDLGEVKYVPPAELESLTNGFSKENFLGRTHFGSLFRAKIQDNSQILREVVVKTWDMHLLHKELCVDSPARLGGEIELRMRDEIKANQNLMKLVGYSFENNLAVVYEFSAKRTLKEEIRSGEMSWDQSMHVAKQLAKFLLYFHDMMYVVAAVDSRSFLVNEAHDIVFCELDLLRRLDKNNSEVDLGDSAKQYLSYAPDLDTGKWWSKKSDVHAFGFVLLELITRRGVERMNKDIFLAKHRSTFNGQSFVDSTFNLDVSLGVEITTLVMQCVDRFPEQRPDMKTVVDTLEKLVPSQKSPKPSHEPPQQLGNRSKVQRTSM